MAGQQKINGNYQYSQKPIKFKAFQRYLEGLCQGRKLSLFSKNSIAITCQLHMWLDLQKTVILQ